MAPKQWKVRPTSPGNRIVEPESQAGTHLLAWVSAGLCLVMIAALAYVFGLVERSTMQARADARVLQR